MKSSAGIFFLLSSASSFVVERNPSRNVNRQTHALAMSEKTMKDKSALYPFFEARKIARGHGFSSKQEFLDYSCPGAYQLPKNPQEVWAEDWKGWDDFLGICHEFEPGRGIARSLNVKSEEEYLSLFTDKKLDDDDPASRLPYRPDLKYKAQWKGWDDWLGTMGS